MKINRIAIVAETDDGVVRHIYTKEETRQILLTTISALEGEIRLSKEPAENVLIKNGKDINED